MPDILSSKLPAPVPDAAGSAAAGKDVLHLSPVSDAEFREIMARHIGQDSGAVSKAAGPVAGAHPGAGPATLGERVMQRATALSGELQKDQQYISKTLEQATRSGDSMQLMKAMLALSDYQTRVQFVSKAAAKAATALDQLTKLQ
ncbi:EscI/YscI/HrpB family type III secretion system inner rod protein [Duganella sp. CT11-25]|uniref:EscI/YscI/HrpB family type III secretion system inner rod protein n=1 Tax=unclassified Duganella TaxID=2636909 RepID=UPI0039AF20CB